MPMGKFPYMKKKDTRSARPVNRKYGANIVSGLKNRMSATVKEEKRGAWVK